MVGISRLAAALSLSSAAAAFSIPSVDKDGMQVQVGFDSHLAFFAEESTVPGVKVYDANTLATMGDLVVELSNSTTPAGPSKRYIIGNDDRESWSNAEYPYSSIGKIQWSNGVCMSTWPAISQCITN